jgi:hypothetical protein
MPAIQTTYANNMAAALAGMVANLELANIVSRNVTVAAMGCGVVAVHGGDDGAIRAPDASNTKFLGITARDRAKDSASADAYRVGDTANVLTQGVVYVVAGEAVARGDAAFFVPASGAVVKTATDNIAIPRATFDASAASGALVPLRIG